MLKNEENEENDKITNIDTEEIEKKPTKKQNEKKSSIVAVNLNNDMYEYNLQKFGNHGGPIGTVFYEHPVQARHQHKSVRHPRQVYLLCQPAPCRCHYVDQWQHRLRLGMVT